MRLLVPKQKHLNRKIELSILVIDLKHIYSLESKRVNVFDRNFEMLENKTIFKAYDF